VVRHRLELLVVVVVVVVVRSILILDKIDIVDTAVVFDVDHDSEEDSQMTNHSCYCCCCVPFSGRAVVAMTMRPSDVRRLHLRVVRHVLVLVLVVVIVVVLCLLLDI
jgi:hypothetical protein